jgi:hypothetical protein
VLLHTRFARLEWVCTAVRAPERKLGSFGKSACRRVVIVLVMKVMIIFVN